MTNFYTLLTPVGKELLEFRGTVTRAQNFVDVLNNESHNNIWEFSHKGVKLTNLSQKSELSVTESGNGQPKHESSVNIEFDMELDPDIHVDIRFRTDCKPIVTVKRTLESLKSDMPYHTYCKIFDYDAPVWGIADGIQYCIVELNKLYIQYPKTTL
jgi:hypothetical protein